MRGQLKSPLACLPERWVLSLPSCCDTVAPMQARWGPEETVISRPVPVTLDGDHGSGPPPWELPQAFQVEITDSDYTDGVEDEKTEQQGSQTLILGGTRHPGSCLYGRPNEDGDVDSWGRDSSSRPMQVTPTRLTPLPRTAKTAGGSMVRRTSSVSASVERLMQHRVSFYRKLKDSVVEVLRISELEIVMASQIMNGFTEFFVILEVFLTSERCIKRKEVIGSFAVQLRRIDKDDALLTELDCCVYTTKRSLDFWVARHERTQGRIAFKLRLMPGTYPKAKKDHSIMSWSFSASLSSLSLPLKTWGAKFERMIRSASTIGQREVVTFSGSVGEEVPPNGATVAMSKRVEGKRGGSQEFTYQQGLATASIHIRVLDAAQAFTIERTRPRLWWFPRVSEWQVLWRSPFREESIHDHAAVLESLVEELRRDVVLVYQTMFANLWTYDQQPALSPEEALAHDRRVLFLKRLYLTFAVCSVSFCIERNSLSACPWKFPLASVLCHGGRVLMTLNGVPWHNFMNFLLFGNTEKHDWSMGVPSPLFARWAGTHAVSQRKDSLQLVERILDPTNISDVAENLSDGYSCHHLAMNLPVGGFGNPVPVSSDLRDGFRVGPAGVPYNIASHASNEVIYHEDVQNGHLYFRWDDFGEVKVPVLVPVTRRTQYSSRLATRQTSMQSRLSHTNDEEMLMQAVATFRKNE